MLTPEEFLKVMDSINLYSYETDISVNEDESTYSPSSTVCDVDYIREVLEKFTLPF